jgi:hypothetical protein
MTPRVSWEREQDEFGFSNPNRRCTVQAKPLIALNAMGLPLGVMDSMFRSIRIPLHKGPWVKKRLQLVGEKMDLCRWEIGQPASVIQMQVRQKDMLHICRVITFRFNLPDGCLFHVTRATDKIRKLPHNWRGGDAITHPPASINQHEPITGLNE